MNNITLTLSAYEVDALIKWHIDKQYEQATGEDYISAGVHKRRVAELKKIYDDSKHNGVGENKPMTENINMLEKAAEALDDRLSIRSEYRPGVYQWFVDDDRGDFRAGPLPSARAARAELRMIRAKAVLLAVGVITE